MANAEKWVRLRNGAVELEQYVGEALVACRQMASSDLNKFQVFADWVRGKGKDLPGPVEAAARRVALLSDSVEPEVYDDVRDVVISMLMHKRDPLAASPLHPDQTDITPPT